MWHCCPCMICRNTFHGLLTMKVHYSELDWLCQQHSTGKNVQACSIVLQTNITTRGKTGLWRRKQEIFLDLSRIKFAIFSSRAFSFGLYLLGTIYSSSCHFRTCVFCIMKNFLEFSSNFRTTTVLISLRKREK